MIKNSGIKIIIHVCNKREWYVQDYLVPSLLLQGIKQQEIKIWHDYNSIGNLRSFLASLEWVHQNLQAGAAAWHLQDDILISKHFKEIIDKEYQGVACGFCFDKIGALNVMKLGRVPAPQMWFSFPCIRIPNKYAGQFIDWFYNSGILKQKLFSEWYQSGKMDDAFFYQFMMRNHYREYVENIYPNIVQHVDWLIGGSQSNVSRNRVCRAFHWQEEELVEDLKKKLGVGKNELGKDSIKRAPAL